MSTSLPENSLEKQLQVQFAQELKRRFDDYLDSSAYIDDDGFVNIDGNLFLPSDVLLTDEGAYQSALLDFQEREQEEFREVIIDNYPTPIAYHFYVACSEEYTLKERFQSLKDTWEALIFLLFGIIAGEYRRQSLPIRVTRNALDTKEKRLKHFCDWKLDTKLTIIEKMIELAENQGYQLAATELFPSNLIQRIRKLNDIRNEYSHTTRKSSLQEESLLSQSLVEVTDILRLADGLQNIRLLRYLQGTRKASEHLFEKFVGRTLDTDRERLILSGEQIAQGQNFLTSDYILIMNGDLQYTIAPWLHFVPADEGHSTRLCFYKNQRETVHYYEVLGQSLTVTVTELNYSTFDNDMTAFDALLEAGNHI
ncbi:MAG: hypothetical protein M5U34_40175 [Chloroflexi bacterium]|nr:hypothetical protein [Chloroflexota bacterium]